MIVIIGGAKGGVGKSLVSAITYDYLLSQGSNPVLIETDNSNPDVFKMYHNKDYNGYKVEPYAKDMDTDKGWAAILNIMSDTAAANRDVVLNTAARNSSKIAENGESINIISESIDVITLWVINDNRDSIILLKDYISIVKQRICVIKNGYFGEESDFGLFEESQLRKDKVIPSVYIPKYTDAMREAIYNQRKAIFELDQSLSFGDRILAGARLRKSREAIKTALDTAVKV